tara:strand:+ start:281 stop:466 length:186 start_codon:yes stop_codon:yes gene_type:complete
VIWILTIPGISSPAQVFQLIHSRAHELGQALFELVVLHSTPATKEKFIILVQASKPVNVRL